MRPDDSQEMTRVLRILARAERLMQAGATLDDALVKMEISREEFGVLFDQYALPPNALEGLSSSSLFDAVVPVFHDDSAGEIEHIGSGIVFDVGNELFLLSAAHVFDSGETGNLYIPTSGSLEAMTGTIANTKLPPSGNRTDDRIDMAYFHLKSEWRDKLKDDVKPVSVDDLLLTDTAQTGNLHTFTGYPWRKTTKVGVVFSGDRTSYSGHLLPPDIYSRLGYSRVANVLIRLRRNKTDSTRYGPGSPAPHPEGVSGGAVLSWPTTFLERVESPRLKLAAIAHTYHEREHCMAGTRVISCVMVILRNNPHLVECFDHIKDMVDELREFIDEVKAATKPPKVRKAVGIAWYRKDKYKRCLRIVHDASSLPNTFQERQRLAKSTEASIKSSGMKAIRVGIDPKPFPHGAKGMDSGGSIKMREWRTAT
jgi:hypothetical protein